MLYIQYNPNTPNVVDIRIVFYALNFNCGIDHYRDRHKQTLGTLKVILAYKTQYYRQDSIQ